ncbi:hypothetical protein IFM89_018148 [Coptis chinensis]|uniref:Uncharacterized protein n=1 Tax=Coptis chinensis TaxID=261450 RepID=A0A835LUS9_9MAGN|nr:hypothetical protein IFM89_018148 [Coptis chinensis]
MVESSGHIVDHFVKAGIVAVGFLSDLVSYKIPTLDGNGTYQSSQSSVVDTTPRVSNSYVKPHSRGNISRVCVKPTVKKCNPPQFKGPKRKAQGAGSVKDLNHVKWTENSVGTQNVPSDAKA